MFESTQGTCALETKLAETEQTLADTRRELSVLSNVQSSLAELGREHASCHELLADMQRHVADAEHARSDAVQQLTATQHSLRNSHLERESAESTWQQMAATRQQDLATALRELDDVRHELAAAERDGQARVADLQQQAAVAVVEAQRVADARVGELEQELEQWRCRCDAAERLQATQCERDDARAQLETDADGVSAMSAALSGSQSALQRATEQLESITGAHVSAEQVIHLSVVVFF